MKRALFIISILLLSAFTSGTLKRQIKVVISPESKISINGKTNINRFNCSFDAINLKSPVSVLVEIIDGDLYFEDTNLLLNTNCFDCGNRQMNSEFKDLLNAKAFPNIILKLKKLEIDNFDGNDATTYMDIYIAGVKKSYTVPISLIGTKEMIIKGKLNLNICDFNLEPPKKMMGLVVVDEIIQINIELIIKEYSFQ